MEIGFPVNNKLVSNIDTIYNILKKAGKRELSCSSFVRKCVSLEVVIGNGVVCVGTITENSNILEQNAETGP